MGIISNTVQKDHRKLIELCKKFERELEYDSKLALKTFTMFKWNIEKHFFIEEKVIFRLSSNEENNEYIK